MEALIKQLVDFFSQGSKELSVFFIAMLPIVELRGSIPIGILYHKIPPLVTYVLSCTGNMVPVIPLLLFFDKLEMILRKNEYSNAFLRWYIGRIKKRTQRIEHLEMWALMFFVAVPLPVTGAWTGSVAAFVLGIRWYRAFISIFCGVLCAGIIVTFLSIAGYSCYAFLQ